ncbi:HEAT repeat domain-containing protein [Actinomycetospora lutea]|uniref:HEAT repeat domain-containing protein n=1 Tax=Actinomycetospora lutea TaxID=663604 RepID=UPI0023673961|nr:HEAT repeat domain-containing protein [Actinomycetospora lutea]MDD7942984.1 HEAT repeat domain-containing protein [Actinomycetospora lutea]
MATTMQDVRSILEPEEPDYSTAAALGSDALPFLTQLVAGADPMLAAKAAYAAGLLNGSDGVDVVRAAASHPDPAVRVAAATAAGQLGSAEASELLTGLVADTDTGVRKVARQSVPIEPSTALAEQLEAQPPDDAPSERPGFDAASIERPMPGESRTLGHGSAGLMPGETADRSSSSRGLMPGEDDAAGSTMMPGEADRSSSRPGLMPGEAE